MGKLRRSMTRGNRLLECPECEEQTLTVERTDTNENNVGFRRYHCSECRKYWTTLEVFFTDDEGDPDSFNQIALNKRIGDREKYHRTKGTVPRRPLKETDQIMVYQGKGSVTLRYLRSPRKKLVWTACRRGHPFDAKNTAINKTTGAQVCRICRRANQNRWSEKNRDKRKLSHAAYSATHKEQKRLSGQLYRQRRKELSSHDISRLSTSQDSSLELVSATPSAEDYGPIVRLSQG